MSATERQNRHFTHRFPRSRKRVGSDRGEVSCDLFARLVVCCLSPHSHPMSLLDLGLWCMSLGVWLPVHLSFIAKRIVRFVPRFKLARRTGGSRGTAIPTKRQGPVEVVLRCLVTQSRSASCCLLCLFLRLLPNVCLCSSNRCRDPFIAIVKLTSCTRVLDLSALHVCLCEARDTKGEASSSSQGDQSFAVLCNRIGNPFDLFVRSCR